MENIPEKMAELHDIKSIIIQCINESVTPMINRDMDELKQLILRLIDGITTESKPRIYTRDEVCNTLNICKATFHNWVNTRKMKSVKIGNRVYVDSAELDRLMNSRDKENQL